VILFNWSGHGLLDLGAYEAYFSGNIKDIELSRKDLHGSEKVYEDFPKPQHLKSV
jgi:tryptophan synthase beta chain